MTTPGTGHIEFKGGKIVKKHSCWNMVERWLRSLIVWMRLSDASPTLLAFVAFIFTETFKNVGAFQPSENTLQSRATSERGSPSS
jgi:hypothetical protein